MSFEVVLSDLGGVVVECESDRLVFQVSRLLGRTFEEVQGAVYHEELLLPFELGRITSEAYYAALKERLKLPWSYAQFVHFWNDIITEKREITQMLPELRKRRKLIALSNTNVLHLEHIQRRFPSMALFDDWVASCQVGCRKPAPEIYELALKRAGVPPQAALYIDDRPELVEAGRTMGLTAVRFENRAQLERELHRLGVEL